ncbi:MAG: type III-B CRISPR module-associated Cmr3 family protein [Ktedonobacteraceae bacterium]
MTIWIIEPRDPLIVRDGRPFGLNPGTQATSLPFPFPSTTTGGVRTQAGLDANGIFETGNIDTVKKIKVRGPLLVQVQSKMDSNELEWFVSAPGDALPFSDEHEEVKQLVPLKLPEGTQTDLDTKEQLMLVGLPQSDSRKPAKNAPLYWNWQTFEKWLINPSQITKERIALSSLGHHGPQRERRIHVSIDSDSFTAKEGMLFGTSGLEFTHVDTNPDRKESPTRLALAMAVDNNEQLSMSEGITSFGGERRIISWRQVNSDLPDCPEKLLEKIIEEKACRIFLLTPAYFESGYLPKWIVNPHNAVTPHLKAIAIQRPQVVSGWDLEHRRPKPTRRLAPAGTVIFLSLDGSNAAIEDWVRDHWMQCISDEEQARNDGFGLAVVGTWSGQAEQMQEEK